MKQEYEREIKFRAWLKDKMYYQDENTASSMNGLERFTQVVGSENGYTPEIMQFTGLLDKNGTEIYEGDILKVGEHNNYIMEFKFGEFRLYSINTRVNDREEYNISAPSYSKTSEIIGNIFSNPELLKN